MNRIIVLVAVLAVLSQCAIASSGPSGGKAPRRCNSCECVCRQKRRFYNPSSNRPDSRRRDRRPPSRQNPNPRPRTETPHTASPRTLPPRTVQTNPRTPSNGGGNPGSSGYPTGSGTCRKCSRENLHYVNDYRSRNGLGTVRWNNHLGGQAEAHSKEMFDRRSMYHSNYDGWENVAYSMRLTDWPGCGQYFFNQWMNSPAHNTNMLKATHECVGIAIHGDGIWFYATQIFSSQCY